MFVGALTSLCSGGIWSSYARPYTATFARHETFHPRYGWLKKGVDLIDRKPAAFADDDVHMDLGVGKNMATSIRYWCEAFGLISSPPLLQERGRGVRYQLTPTARDLIAGAQAFDPYLESTATLWWLHYYLIKTQKATAWNFAIDHFGRTNFTVEQLEHDLKKYVQLNFSDHKIADSSLSKDAHLFLRMYAFDETEKLHEDSIDSPFIELGLIHKRGKEYGFVIGAKPTLPNAVIAAACLDFAASNNAKSISLSQLMMSDLSPVKAFRLTEASLYEALESVAEKESDLFLSDTAGVKQLSYKADPQRLAHKLLKGYYRSVLTGRASAPGAARRQHARLRRAMPQSRQEVGL